MAGASINLNPKAKAHGFSARFVCLTGKDVKGGKHPIRLQLIHNLKVKRFSTGEACAIDHWDAEAGRMKPRAVGAAQINGVLNALEAQVVGIVDALVVHRSLTLDGFEARYRRPKASEDVLAFMDEVVDEMERAGKVGNAATYRNTARILRRFTGRKPLPFVDLTPAKLEKLEYQLRSEGCTGGGISVYMRTLRAVVGKAMKAGLMHRDQYPFETGTQAGYSLTDLKSERNPRALTEENMDKLKRFPFADHPHLEQAVRLFLFSYYARGMNFADIARLKRSDVYDGRIFYRRSKTKEPFAIPVSAPLAEILANFDSSDPTYLFPILTGDHATEKQQWYRIQKCLKRMNLELKEAGDIVGITVPLTSYVARHTFATTLKRKGVDVAVISESMGHESINTTRAYLKRFGSEVLDAADTLL
ncbi:MAG: site-specific integrase [Bacteroidetes bacterium]|nr:site-specific integrase [Bacteroidota bacterium]